MSTTTPSCATCQHWDPHPEPFVAIDCDASRANLTTSPDFGCVLHTPEVTR